MIIPVPSAESVVSRHRRRLDVAASWGVPAHVTVLFPFVPPVDIDDQVVAQLAAVFAATPPFECTFDRCAWFGDEVLWLAPNGAQRFRDMTEQVVERFPGHLPYGGAHHDVVPHLTVGESRSGTLEELKAAESDISGLLPITARVDHGLLIAGTDQPDSWRTVATLPLNGPL